MASAILPPELRPLWKALELMKIKSPAFCSTSANLMSFFSRYSFVTYIVLWRRGLEQFSLTSSENLKKFKIKIRIKIKLYNNLPFTFLINFPYSFGHTIIQIFGAPYRFKLIEGRSSSSVCIQNTDPGDPTNREDLLSPFAGSKSAKGFSLWFTSWLKNPVENFSFIIYSVSPGFYSLFSIFQFDLKENR